MARIVPLMNNPNAAARLARLAATLSPAALAAFIREERAVLADMNGFAFFNGGRSAELETANVAFAAFCAAR